MNRYTKAITATIGALATIAGVWGLDIEPEIVAAVTTLVTALAVFWLPNADPEFDAQGRTDRLDP